MSLAARPLLDESALRGIADTLGVLRQIAPNQKEAERPLAFLRLEGLTRDQPANLEEIILRIRAARELAQDLLLHYRGQEADPRVYWAQQISKQVAAWNGVIDKYLRPVEILMSPPAQLMSLGEATHESRREALAATFSLRNIAIEGISGLVPLLPFYQRREDQEISRDVREWLDLLVDGGRPFAPECLGAARAIGRIDRPEPGAGRRHGASISLR